MPGEYQGVEHAVGGNGIGQPVTAKKRHAVRYERIPQAAGVVEIETVPCCADRGNQAAAIWYMRQQPDRRRGKLMNRHSPAFQHTLVFRRVDDRPVCRVQLDMMAERCQRFEQRRDGLGGPAGNGIYRRQDVQDAHGAVG